MILAVRFLALTVCSVGVLGDTAVAPSKIVGLLQVDEEFAPSWGRPATMRHHQELGFLEKRHHHKESDPGTSHRKGGSFFEDNLLMLVGGGVILLVACGVGTYFFISRTSEAAGAPGVTPPCILVSRFSVPPGRMEDFREYYNEYYAYMKPHEEGTLYFGFAENEKDGMAVCRSAHLTAEQLQTHLKNTAAAIKALTAIGTLVEREVQGPSEELEKLKAALPNDGCKFLVADPGTKQFGGRAPSNWKNTTVSDRTCAMYLRFQVSEDKMSDFQSLFDRFHTSLKSEEEGLLFHGFAVDEASGTVVCHEAHKTADGLLTHIGNVDVPLKEACALATAVEWEVHAPAKDLDKVRPSLQRQGCKFFASDGQNKTWIQDSKDVAVDVDVETLVKQSVGRLA